MTIATADGRHVLSCSPVQANDCASLMESLIETTMSDGNNKKVQWRASASKKEVETERALLCVEVVRCMLCRKCTKAAVVGAWDEKRRRAREPKERTEEQVFVVKTRESLLRNH